MGISTKEKWNSSDPQAYGDPINWYIRDVVKLTEADGTQYQFRCI